MPRYIFEGTIEEIQDNKSGGCMSIIGVIVLIIFIYVAFAQDSAKKSKVSDTVKKEATVQNTYEKPVKNEKPINNEQNSELKTEVVDVSSRNTYTSNIAGQDVTFYIEGFDDKLEGSYYYNKIGREIKLIESSRNEEEIVLMEFADGRTYAKLTLQFFDGNSTSVNGIFTTVDGKQYNFVLQKMK